MPVFNSPPPPETEADVHLVNGRGSFFASPSTPMATPSPLIDAIDSPLLNRKRSWISSDEFRNAELGVVKIGQTSLHNPSGKSSWIGL